MELPKSRINASMLAQFIDRPVCFVGKLEKIHPSGKMFVLSDGEGKNGTIELMEPLEEEISGIVEVVGRVTAKATIMCSSYVQFREDNHPFDEHTADRPGEELELEITTSKLGEFEDFIFYWISVT